MSEKMFDEILKTYYPSCVDSKEYPKMVNVCAKMYEGISKLSANESYSKSDLECIFEGIDIKSRSMFAIYKSVAIHLIEYLKFDSKTVSVLKSFDYFDVFTPDDISGEYWGSLEEILSEIEFVCVTDKLSTLIVAELLWYGIKTSEMREVLISDIDEKNATIRVNGACVKVDQVTISHISHHISSRRNASIYLFCGRGGAKSSDAAIRKKLCVLNESGNSSKRFDGRKILYSGKFSRVFEGKESISKYTKDVLDKYERWKIEYRM